MTAINAESRSIDLQITLSSGIIAIHNSPFRYIICAQT